MHVELQVLINFIGLFVLLCCFHCRTHLPWIQSHFELNPIAVCLYPRISSDSKSINPGSGVTSPTSPRPGSIQAPRSYGQGGINKWFLDSFPILPKQGGRVCGVEVQVSGFVNPGSIQNDSITVIGSRNFGLQNTGAPSWSWNFPVLGGASLAQVSGAFTKTVSITGSNWSSWLMAAPNPSLDIAVQDDTTVNAVMVTFYTY